MDYFLASLVTRLPQHADDTGWIDHFLFVKGKDEYSRITDSIKIVEWPTDFAALINHSVQGRSGKRRIRGEDRTRPIPEQTSTVWYETPEGREILAEDRRIFRESFKEDVRVTRRGRSITMTGLLGSVAISMTYPSDPEELQVAVSVSQQGVVILQIGSDLRWRGLALTAALAAAAPLRRPQ